jgi:hypothetical protein
MTSVVARARAWERGMGAKPQALSPRAKVSPRLVHAASGSRQSSRIVRTAWFLPVSYQQQGWSVAIQRAILLARSTAIGKVLLLNRRNQMPRMNGRVSGQFHQNPHARAHRGQPTAVAAARRHACLKSRRIQPASFFAAAFPISAAQRPRRMMSRRACFRESRKRRAT